MAQPQWNRVSGYTGDQMMQMQRDAERRVREMQRRADRSLNQNQSASMRAVQESEEAVHQSPPRQQNNPPPRNNEAPFSQQAMRPPNMNPHMMNPRPPQGGFPPNPIAGFLGSLSGNAGQGNSLAGILNNFGIGGNSGGETPIKKVLDTLHLDNERILLIFLIILLLNDGGDTTLILALCYLVI